MQFMISVGHCQTPELVGTAEGLTLMVYTALAEVKDDKYIFAAEVCKTTTTLRFNKNPVDKSVCSKTAL